MAKSKYTITQQDVAAATTYLSRKLDDGYWLSEELSQNTKAEREHKNTKRDPVTLNAWCEKWLDSAQWTQLKNAIRAARRREADLKRDPPKHITVSHQAWVILRDLSKSDGVTYSEFIETRLEKEWMKL